MNSALSRILSRESLRREDAAHLLSQMLDGTLSDVQIAAILSVMASRGETVDEVSGFVDTMRSRMTAVPITADPVDGCGTGGDSSGTFNISTTASLLAAAAGVPVVKHGNRAVSSRSGSADLLEHLEYQMPTSAADAVERFTESGFVFLFAPYFHPAMARVKEIRRELGVRTIFNLLGPLCNPAGVTRQVIGVYAPHLMTLLGDVAVATGSKRLVMVHSQDGMDEFSISAPTAVREWTGNEWREYSVTPESVGLRSANRAELTADSVEASASLVRDVLTGRPGGARDVAVLNAAALLYVGGKVHSTEEGVQSLKELFATGTVSDRSERIIRGEKK